MTKEYSDFSVFSLNSLLTSSLKFPELKICRFPVKKRNIFLSKSGFFSIKAEHFRVFGSISSLQFLKKDIKESQRHENVKLIEKTP